MLVPELKAYKFVTMDKRTVKAHTITLKNQKELNFTSNMLLKQLNGVPSLVFWRVFLLVVLTMLIMLILDGCNKGKKDSKGTFEVTHPYKCLQFHYLAFKQQDGRRPRTVMS